MKGIGVMATFSMPCKLYSNSIKLADFNLKVGRLVDYILNKYLCKFGVNQLRNEWVIKQTSAMG